MTTSIHKELVDERLANLERRLQDLETMLVPLRHRAHRPTSLPVATTEPGGAEPFREPERPYPKPPIANESARRAAGERTVAMGDLLGGRVLAWIGGVAVLLGIVLFLALAISRGWIGIEARVIFAALGSSALMGTGMWLHPRRGRTEASIAMVGTATSGLFATLIVASEVYGLIAPLVAVAGAMVVGALATALATRWAGKAIGAIGLLGALASPVLVGAAPDAVVVTILAVGGACATWTAVAKRWNWLALTSVLICAGQWGYWLGTGQPVLADVGTLAWFSGLGLVGALGMRAEGERHGVIAAASLASLSAIVTAVIGASVLQDAAGGYWAEVWLLALAVAHAGAGLAAPRWTAVPIQFRRLLLVIGVVLADGAFGLSATGIGLAIGWGATAVAFAVLHRRAFSHDGDELLVRLGIGTHIALTLARALIAAPPSTLGHSPTDLVSTLSVATLAASCLASGYLAGPRTAAWVRAVNAIGLAAVAYLTAQALTGASEVTAFALEAAALAEIARRSGDGFPRFGMFAFLGVAALHTLAIEAPPSALLTGVSSLPETGVALGALALAQLLLARADQQLRPLLVTGSAAALLYLASAAIITVFQPSSVIAAGILLDLSARQEGQVLLSACWSVVGLVGLVAGLRRNSLAIRNASLGLLLLTVMKVFLYDLSTLTSLYRVASFIALGLLLLAGAFAYQRLRPPATTSAKRRTAPATDPARDLA
jgi:uncharacterized membrane protein